MNKITFDAYDRASERRQTAAVFAWTCEIFLASCIGKSGAQNSGARWYEKWVIGHERLVFLASDEAGIDSIGAGYLPYVRKVKKREGSSQQPFFTGVHPAIAFGAQRQRKTGHTGSTANDCTSKLSRNER